MEVASRSPSAASGCIVCRSRKVRCDKKQPLCRNCARLGVPCPGYSTDDRALSRKEIVTSTEKIFRAAGKQRRRMGACEACRASKEQCTRAKPSCQRCLLRGIPCVYRAVEKKPARPLVEAGRSSYPAGGVLAGVGYQVDLPELCSNTLPVGETLRSLVITYFDRIQSRGHTGVVHKPSFMKALDRGTVHNDFGVPTLHIICALGASFMESTQPQRRGAPGSPIPGQNWAEKARQDVLLTAYVPTMQDLVAMILVCEYALRTHQHALLFTLSGCLFRAICLLGLDDPDQPIAHTQTEVLRQETANRIVWASYHIDSLIAPAIDKHSSWRDDYPHIPLPRSNQDFLALNPGPAVALGLLDTLSDLSSTKTLDLPALITVMFRLRRTVLRIIRTTPDEATPIWSETSPFRRALLQLDTFYSNIPDRLRLTDLNMYMYKDQHTLGAVFLLHLLFHAAVFDLTRISLAGFSFPLATAFRGAPFTFLQECQRRCFLHAHEISNMVHKVEPYKAMIADQPMWAGALFESAKIQLVYAATVQTNAQTHQLVRQNLRAHLHLLDFLHTGKGEQSPCIRVILSLCTLFGLEDIAREFHGTHLDPDESTYVTGSSDMHHLTNFALFRLARAEIQARQVNLDRAASPSSGYSQSATQRPLFDPGYGAPQMVEPGRCLSQTNDQGSDRESQSMSHVQELQPPAPGSELSIENQPSVEDYIRTAESMCDYLAWDSMESWQSWEWPPWETIDPSGLPSRQSNQ